MSLSANWAPWSSLALSLSEPSGPRRDFFLRSPTAAEPGAAPKAILREAAPPQPASSLPKCTTGGETSEGRRTTERSPSPTLAPDTLCPRAARPAGWPVTTRLSQGHGGGEGTPSTRQRALASEKHACGDRGREGASATSPCSPWPGEPFRPHGSEAAGCSQASLDQEDLFV